MYQGWDEILMVTLISSKKLGVCNNMRNTVIPVSGIPKHTGSIEWELETPWWCAKQVCLIISVLLTQITKWAIKNKKVTIFKVKNKAIIQIIVNWNSHVKWTLKFLKIAYRNYYFFMISVPKEHRALQLLQQCRWCLHPVNPVFRGPPETGMSGNYKEIWPFLFTKKKRKESKLFQNIFFFRMKRSGSVTWSDLQRLW